MSSILVTGGGGFVGAAVARALAKRGDAVTVLDMTRTPALETLVASCPTVRFAQVQMTDAAQLLEAVRQAAPQAIIHCAAIIGAAAPEAIVRTNLEGSLTLLGAMRMFDVPRMIHISSEEVYGAFNADMISEDHPCVPTKIYGVAKLAFEQMARIIAGGTERSVVHLRTSWVYGPGLPRQRMPKTFIDAALANTPLSLPEGGDLRLDQTYIDDLTAGIIGALDLPHHPYDTYHIASGTAPSVAEIAGIVNELVPGARISVGPGRRAFDGPEPARKGALNVERARIAFGYVPRYPIREGIAAYIDATRQGVG
jgi:UDP-glucose 4-epimerase